LAEWSKALASGASPQGRGFEPHSCHFVKRQRPPPSPPPSQEHCSYRRRGRGDDAGFRGSIVVSISACHAEDPGSIPGRGVWRLAQQGLP
jgi:hypothetical protein